MIRYLSPDSSEEARCISVAQSTYSGIESSSMPMNSVTRFCAATRIAMPAIDASSSEWYSPCADSRGACARQESSTAAAPAALKMIVRASVRSSTARAPEIAETWSFHCQIVTPSVTARVSSVSAGTACSRAKRERSSPTSSTITEPASSASNGEIAA